MPPPYTAGGTVADLHRLLSVSAKLPPPLVYVGAGLGALNARLYAHLYPRYVSGDCTSASISGGFPRAASARLLVGFVFMAFVSCTSAADVNVWRKPICG